MDEWWWLIFVPSYILAAVAVAIVGEAANFWRGLLALLWPLIIPLWLVECACDRWDRKTRKG